MARTTNPTPGTAPSQTVESLDNAHLELGYLLDRLQQSLLHPDPAQERRLLTDEYERIRLTSNLEYAKRTLTELANNARIVPSVKRLKGLSTEISQKQELIDMLFDRMQDYDKD